jgi:hypothetical protein
MTQSAPAPLCSILGAVATKPETRERRLMLAYGRRYGPPLLG